MIATGPTTDAAEEAAPLPAARRSFVKACLAGGLAATVSFVWLLAGGRLDFTQRGPLGNFYDAQARSLFHGHWNVPPGAVYIEGIKVGGRTYTYFSPWPAVLRMPVLLVTNRFDGRLSQLSILLAFAVAMVFTCRLFWRVRRIVRGDAPVSRLEWWGTAAMVLSFGAGSALYFMAGRAFVYHESLIWGLAGAMASYDMLVAFLQDGTAGRDHDARRHLVLAGVFATIAFLSRPSVGGGPVVALALVLLGNAAGTSRRPRLGVLRRLLGVPERMRRWWAPTAVALTIPVVLYAYVNYAKFGTLFSVPFDKQVFTQIDTLQQKALRANGNSLFGLKFVPTTLLQYLRPDAVRPTHLFPFVAFPRRIVTLFNVHLVRTNASSSVVSTMPGLVVLAVLGAIATFRRSAREDGLQLLRIPALASAVAIVPTLAIGYIDNHYLGDFVPLLAILGIVGFLTFFERLRTPPHPRRRSAGMIVAALLAIGLWTNFGLALVFQRQLAPSVDRLSFAGADYAALKSFIGFQESLAKPLHLPRHVVHRIPIGRSLGTRHFVDELTIVGDCDGLYWNAGDRWWPLQTNRRVGTETLRIQFDPNARVGSSEPLASWGDRGYEFLLVARTLSRGRVTVQVKLPGYQGLYGARPVTLRKQTWHDVEITVDPYVNHETVVIDGAVAFDAALGVSARSVPIALGVNPYGSRIGVTDTFRGVIQPRPQSKSYCRQFG